MKGYLSRLAKQSGLRFPESRVEVLAPGLAPEVEQTVMFEPGVPEPRSSPATRAAPPPQRVGDVGADHEGYARAPASSASVQREARDPATALPTTRTVETSDAGRLRLRTTPGKPPDAFGPSDAPRVVRQTTLQQRDAPASGFERAPRSDSLTPGTPEADVSSDPARLVAKPKEYFARTAEILSAEGVTPESHTTVLREVQEWVAASPMEPPSAPRVRDPARVAQVAPARVPEAVAIRDSQLKDESGRTQPMEQTFELSIGSIDVTIEEAEKPQAPDPRNARNGQAASADERRFSRLSRSYL